MPIDGLAEETSKPHVAINNNNDDENQDDNNDANTTNAVPRLRQEAKQFEAMANKPRGLRDVTREFTSASQRLAPGELVKDEFFTLFESVGALEIMDPKMDSGYVPADDAFEPEFEPSSGLDATEIIWIMDQLLSLEITWLDGYPLSQTIYTSLHIDRLLSPNKIHSDEFYFSDQIPAPRDNKEILVHKILRAYCIGLIKCSQLSLHLIQSQNFYEEEDFVTHLFGRELLPQVGSLAAKDSLVDAITRLAQLELAEDIRQALTARCRFRLTLLQTLSDDERRWEEGTSYLQLVKESHDLASPVPAAFSEKIQRQLATSTPPRPMIQISFDLACSKWTALCQEMIAAYTLTSDRIIQSPHCLQRATWAFAYRGQPGTLSRAKMQSMLFTDQAVAGKALHYDLLLTDISDLVLAGDPLVDPLSFTIEVPSDPRHICSKLLQSFMEKAIEEYLNIYRMVCQNRCRIRRTFTQAIPILDALEQEAENVDGEIKKYSATMRNKIKHPKHGRWEELNPLQSWCHFNTLRVMAWAVQLGFETEIYLPDELGRMYKFLSTLCFGRWKLVDHMIRFVGERKRSVSDSQRSAECAASYDFLRSLSDFARVTESLAEALFKFYTLLTRVGIIRPPKRDFAKRDLLHEVRMKPFLLVRGWEKPNCESLDEDIEEENTLHFAAVIKSIDDEIKIAKTALGELKKYTPEQGKYVGTEEEWKREIKQMETTCVAIAVGASQLKRIREKYGGAEGDADLGTWVECGFEKKYHEWWVVPQLSERVQSQ